DGEREGQRGGLGQDGPAQGEFGRRPGGGGTAVDPYRPGRRGQVGGEGAQQGGFARPVGADEGEDLAGPRGDVDAGEDVPATEPDGDPLGLDEDVAGLDRKSTRLNSSHVK